MVIQWGTRLSAATKYTPVKYAQVPFGALVAQGITYPGGLDLSTPALRLHPGALRDVLNFECAQSGGYARIGGYERLDGRAAPSAAVYTVIQLTGSPPPPITILGLLVTQAVSGATGIIIAVVDDVASYIVVTRVTGAFDDTHALTATGPIAVGTATTLTVFLTELLDAQYLNLAADSYRALIGAVPGSGAVTGVVGMTFAGVDNVYAFRPNAGNTATVLYKASATGWTLVPFYNLIAFTAGSGSPPADGATLTQGGVTATVKRVMWQSGTWASNAAGQFVITNPAGGNFAAGAATTTGGAAVTLTAVQTAITLAVGGRFEFVKCNFSGQAVTRRIYGCDGVNPAFEFDGDTLAPIKTGLSPDSPSHIAFHKNYLFVSKDSSLLHCGVGTPFKWSTTDGGGEIATGDIVNGMITLPGDQTTATLGIFLRGNPAMLYGTDPSTFNFVTFNTNAGALPYSVQNVFDTFVFDDLGVITLRTTLNWGNFASSTLTKNILPFVIAERNKLTATSINQEKSQYRVFFSDGYGLWLTVVNQQYLGACLVLFPNSVFCTDDADLTTGGMATYFGSSDGLGYVYQLDKGTSFDGADINAYFTAAWDFVKTPRMLKQFRAASIEVQGDGYAAISYGYQLGYGNTQIAQPSPVDVELGFAPTARWDSFTWDEFIWDGVNLMPSDVDEIGTAENIQIMISSGTDYIVPYTINSVIHHYSMRRGMRV